jgi:hypothetical protein
MVKNMSNKKILNNILISTKEKMWIKKSRKRKVSVKNYDDVRLVQEKKDIWQFNRFRNKKLRHQNDTLVYGFRNKKRTNFCTNLSLTFESVVLSENQRDKITLKFTCWAISWNNWLLILKK